MFNEGSADRQTREELAAVSAAWERAFVANDAEAIGEFMAPDWVIVSDTGMATRDDFLALVASGDLTHDTFEGEVLSVRRYGDTAIVTGRLRNNGAYQGRAFSADEWTTDVFVPTGGVWRCVHSHITTANERRVDSL
jgi:ketosteroid isomerase-like protein